MEHLRRSEINVLVVDFGDLFAARRHSRETESLVRGRRLTSALDMSEVWR
jgi:hypothetical protein